MCNIIIFVYHCSRTNIKPYGRRLFVRTLSGVLHTSPVVRPTYWNLAPSGSSLCMHNGLSKVCLSVVVLTKNIVGDDIEAPKAPQWGIPHPWYLALLFMIMRMGVWLDLSQILLRPFLLSYLVFVVIFSLFFLSLLCVKLSCPAHLTHRPQVLCSQSFISTAAPHGEWQAVTCMCDCTVA